MNTSKDATNVLARIYAFCARGSAIACLLIGMMALVPAEAQAKAKKKTKSDTESTTATAKVPIQTQSGKASWYKGYRRTASGLFDPKSMTAAHRTLPFGTIICATADNGKRVYARIDNRGPFIRGRILDFTPAAFEQLAPLDQGLVSIRMEVISRP